MALLFISLVHQITEPGQVASLCGFQDGIHLSSRRARPIVKRASGCS